ncbi:MAG: TolC family protein [Syntrophobacteraceae bacterium]
MTKKNGLRNRITLMLLCVFFITLNCLASQAAEQRVLSLEQLIQMALETSPELKMAEQDILAAKGDYKQAKGGMLPQLDFVAIGGPVNAADVPTVTVVRNTGYLVGHDFPGIGVFGSLDLTITQPLYTFGKISNRKDAAALGVEVQSAAREKKRNEVVLYVKELYYAYLIAAQGKSAAREADNYINDAGKRIRRLLELKAKNVDPSDLYRLDAFSAEVRAFAAKADSGANTSYAALKSAIGLPENGDFRLAVTEMPKNPENLGSQEEYVQRALANRPEIMQVKKGAEARGKLVCAAEADLYPTFFASGLASVAGAPGRQTFDNTYIIDEFNHTWAGLIAGAQWHFDFGIGKGKLDKARAEYQKMRNTQELAERNIPVEVVKYYQDTVEAEKSYAAYEQAAIGSRRWVVTAFSNFDLGIGTARDMFDAIDRYGKNQGEYLRALYNYRVGLARLDYATGQTTGTP